MKKILALVLTFSMIFGLCACNSDSKTYKEAQELFENADYKAAAEKFESISSYKDSSDKAIISALNYADQCAAKSDFKSAVDFLRNYADDDEVKAAFDFFASEATKKALNDLDFVEVLNILEKDFSGIELTDVFKKNIKSNAFIYFVQGFTFDSEGIDNAEAIEELFSKFDISDNKYNSLLDSLKSNKEAFDQYAELYEVVITYDAMLGEILTTGLNGILENNKSNISVAAQKLSDFVDLIKGKYGTKGRISDFLDILNEYKESFNIIATSNDADLVNSTLNRVDNASLSIQSLYSDIDKMYGIKVNQIVDLIKGLL